MAQTGTRRKTGEGSQTAASRAGKNKGKTNTGTSSGRRKSAAASRKTSAGKKPRTSKTGKGAGKKTRGSIWEEYDFSIFCEILQWVIAALSIILFISSFEQLEVNLLWLKKINFGLFGWGGYISVLLTGYLAFFVIPNFGTPKTWLRLTAVFLIAASVCGMMQIFGIVPLELEASIGECYRMGYEQGGGGVFGGLIVKLFYPYFGQAGTAVFLFFLIIIGIVIISEKSGIEFLRKITSALYDDVKQDIQKYGEGREVRIQKRREVREKAEAKAAQRKASQRKAEKEAEQDKNKRKRQENRDDSEADSGQDTAKKDSRSKKRRTKEDAFPSASEKEEQAFTEKQENSDQKEQGRRWFDHPTEEESEDLPAAEFPDEPFEFDSSEDPYVKSTVEAIRKRVKRRKELEEEEQKPLMEWTDTTEDTPHSNPADYTEEKEKYSNTSGSDQARSAAAGTRRVVTASGKIITAESDEIPPATKKRTIPGKSKNPNGDPAEHTAPKEILNGREPVQEDDTAKEQAPPKPYCFPTPDMLTPSDRKSNGKNQEKELQETAVTLEQTFRDFGVGVTVTSYSCGPTVTRYELEPDQGVKVSRVTALSDDIKLKLAATDIRIEAPIPGKAAIGIEVPNRENSTVMFRELIESDAFLKHPSRLAFAVGKDIGGKVIVFDIARMPHVLIAGATGSGKSVCINTLIMSILYKAKPSEVKLIMVDPKVVELSVYNGIPHLLIPVVTDPKKAAGALNWAVAEMTRRYQLFAETTTRDLAGYNQKAREIREQLEKEGMPLQEGPEILPQIVIIVDELADLMMVAPGEVEDAICRLAQMARAAGLHLVLATQRPSVNVITGLIKANVPSRIAFSVSSGVDSRTIIDMNGAEKLLGKGDMLFYPFGYNKPIRVQGAFVSDQEVSSVVGFLKKENGTGETEGKQLTLDFIAEESSSKGAEADRDEYFEKAGYFLIEKEKGSIGMLQRMFKIGFNRAARIMEQLAEAGVVGPEEGTKPRKILMSREEFQSYLENNS